MQTASSYSQAYLVKIPLSFRVGLGMANSTPQRDPPSIVLTCCILFTLTFATSSLLLLALGRSSTEKNCPSFLTTILLPSTFTATDSS